MRKRDSGPAEPVPAGLLTFRPDDWPGGDMMARFGAWKAARRAFVAEHGDSTALGDIVDLLRAEVAEKARRAVAPPA
jgi:hypothetical protein